MQIKRVLEELGDESISTHTPIMCPAGHLDIEMVDIMEIVVKYSQKVQTTVEDILKLLIEGKIVGSTEIVMANGDDDPFETFEYQFLEKQIITATTP